MNIVNVVGARPNFMKIAPLMAAYREFPSIEPLFVRAGQHYERVKSQLFVDELRIPMPDIDLGIGSATHIPVRLQAAVAEAVIEKHSGLSGRTEHQHVRLASLIPVGSKCR